MHPRLPLAPSLSLALIVTFLASIASSQMRLEPRADGPEATNSPRLRLEEESLEVVIDGQFSTSHLRQVYHNSSTSTLEALCTLRTALDSQVQGFSYFNGPTRIVGEVFERETARRIYEDTTGLGRDPGLLEERGPGSFEFRVFPVAPDEHKRIEVTVGQYLPRFGRDVQYRFPLASETANVRVTLRDSRPLAKIGSPSHDLEQVTNGQGQRVLMARPKHKRAAAFVLDYVVDEPYYTLAVHRHQDPGQPAYLAVSMATPPHSGPSLPKDITIVLDRSGSMTGAALDEARLAAKQLVSSLSPRDHVNVLVFDDQVQVLAEQNQPLTDKTRAAALAFLDEVSPGGGTNIALALTRALAVQRAGADRPLVLLLTDGASEPLPALKALEHDTGATRVFTIGLGGGVNRALLSRLAAMKRGRFNYVESPAAIPTTVKRLLSQLEAVSTTSPSLSLESEQLSHPFPNTLSDLAAGEELFVTARAEGTGKARMVFSARTSSGPLLREAWLDLGSELRQPAVARRWARARVDHLLEDQSLFGANEERKNEVVELALSYNLVTPHTSFLAIPETEQTEATTTLLGTLREQKRALLARRPDAAALSRSEMPPGDPVLTVEAPRDALRVTAFFPFGLTRDLTFDETLNRWRLRFLVPIEVTDGTYRATVLIVTRDGQSELREVPYIIDSQRPEFSVEVSCVNTTMTLLVRSTDRVREVRAAPATEPNRRLDLHREPGSAMPALYRGELRLGARSDRVNLVVTDLARNEQLEVVTCPAEAGSR